MNDVTGRIEQLESDMGELLYERRTKGADPFARFRSYADDPIGFIEKEPGARLWSKQREIAEAVRDHPRVVVHGAHGMGKDHLAARLAKWWVYAVGGLVVLTAATERQLLGILVRKEFQQALRRHRGLPGTLYANTLRIDGRDRLVAFPSGTIDAMTGWHDERVLVVISEGQGESVEENAYDAAFGMATSAGSRILVVGNPVRPSGRFYDVANSPGWKAIQVSALAHPNILTGQPVIPSGPDRSWVDAVEQEYGRTSDYFRSRVEGSFPLQAIDSLIPRAWLDAAVGREIAA